ncbi:hypothetical protein SBC1_54040 (plasmid) [Caballeronia sp. SBC1]|uniref:hypothetical protein n=1 Tax=unclassified Caballeronia TaxID=2646786 RepID=UPI0013E0F689|nr:MULTISPECIES: hypothetical protein [unclassified Caballeronia]QIE27164.1 hypothetical protein SBC2_52340 [Caballeronia sp. SBC2]QIN65359.1 hypothetical protein SBC1_54040 [Caballeronia sp. SBC1]
MVNCVSANPLMREHWIIDYRIKDPDGDGKTKRDYVRGILTHLIHCQRRSFCRIPMDIWYIALVPMLFVESLKKNDYCPLCFHQHVDDSGARSHRRKSNN